MLLILIFKAFCYLFHGTTEKNSQIHFSNCKSLFFFTNQVFLNAQIKGITDIIQLCGPIVKFKSKSCILPITAFHAELHFLTKKKKKTQTNHVQFTKMNSQMQRAFECNNLMVNPFFAPHPTKHPLCKLTFLHLPLFLTNYVCGFQDMNGICAFFVIA